MYHISTIQIEKTNIRFNEHYTEIKWPVICLKAVNTKSLMKYGINIYLLKLEAYFYIATTGSDKRCHNPLTDE